MSEIQTEIKRLRIWMFRVSIDSELIKVVADTVEEAEQKLKAYLIKTYGETMTKNAKIKQSIFGGNVII